MAVMVEPITAEAFAPFGRLITTPSTYGRQSFADSLDHDERPAALSTTHVAVSSLPLRVEQLERHRFSTQTFLPLDVVRWLVIVSTTPDPDGLRAFLVGPGVGVTIGRGVWHHGLTALDRSGSFAVMMWKDGETDDEFVAIEAVDVEDDEQEANEPPGPIRDLLGYGRRPPLADWPNGARLAINFVLNVEEGSEPSVPDGDGYTENRLTDSSVVLGTTRDLAAEGLFEYGSRVGFWRIQRAFQERGIPLTMFACALALERTPAIAEAIIESGSDVCSHGYRWINHRELSEDDEREQIVKAVESFRRTLGHQPAGWYCRYGPSVNTRRLLVEHGGFMYDSDAYNDDLPYWSSVAGAAHLVVPYSLTTNDAKLLTMDGRQWSDFISDGVEVLLREGAERPAMMSIGLHARVSGQPARFAGVQRLLDRVSALDGVWLTSRVAIAEHWISTQPA